MMTEKKNTLKKLEEITVIKNLKDLSKEELKKHRFFEDFNISEMMSSCWASPINHRSCDTPPLHLPPPQP